MVNIQPISGANVWRSVDIEGRMEWQLAFDSDVRKALQESIQSCDWNNPPDVGGLCEKLRGHTALIGLINQVNTQLQDGYGFVRIRGFPINDWPESVTCPVWEALCRLIGTPVYQNPHGQLLREICAEPGDVGERHGALATADGRFLSSRARTASNAELRFHTDRCDVVGLLCLSAAQSGGISRIASAIAIHNALLDQDPELCEVLYQPLPRSRVGEEVGGDHLWYWLPVFDLCEGYFTSHYSRTYVEALEHIPGAPKVSSSQWHALNRLAELADQFALSMTLMPGDIQFLNNHVIYHARTAFQDNQATGQVRRLLRVWITAPHQPLPESHRVLWRQTQRGKPRGGIQQAHYQTLEGVGSE